MGWKVITLIIAAMFAVVLAYLGRYEMIAAHSGGEGDYGQVYRLDRWTGGVRATIQVNEGMIMGEVHVLKPN